MEPKDNLQTYFDNLLKHVDYENIIIKESTSSKKKNTKPKVKDDEYSQLLKEFYQIDANTKKEDDNNSYIYDDTFLESLSREDTSSRSEDTLLNSSEDISTSAKPITTNTSPEAELLNSFSDSIDTSQNNENDLIIDEEIITDTPEIINESESNIQPAKKNKTDEIDSIVIDDEIIENEIIEKETAKKTQLIAFDSLITLSLTLVQRKQVNFFNASYNRLNESEHLSLVLDFSPSFSISYTITTKSAFDLFKNIENQISINSASLTQDETSKELIFNINGNITKSYTYLSNDKEISNEISIPFSESFPVKLSNNNYSFLNNKKTNIYPYNKKFLSEYKLCLNILKSSIKDSFSMEENE